MRRIATMVVALALGATACGGGTPGGSTTPPTSAPVLTNPTTGPGGGTTTGSGGSTTPPSSKPTESAVPTESPVPVESNPPGDIPDSTQFVPFHSASGGFEIKIPEGWARTTTSNSVTFVSKLNAVSLSWRQSSTQPTAAAVKKAEVPELQRTFRAFQLVSVKEVTLPGGKAVQIDFQANSEPNSVTGKQYRLDVRRFDFFRNGREVSLDLSAPVGSDNVDAWKLISESFRWR